MTSNRKDGETEKRVMKTNGCDGDIIQKLQRRKEWEIEEIRARAAFRRRIDGRDSQCT